MVEFLAAEDGRDARLLFWSPSLHFAVVDFRCHTSIVRGSRQFLSDAFPRLEHSDAPPHCRVDLLFTNPSELE